MAEKSESMFARYLKLLPSLEALQTITLMLLICNVFLTSVSYARYQDLFMPDFFNANGQTWSNMLALIIGTKLTVFDFVSLALVQVAYIVHKSLGLFGLAKYSLFFLIKLITSNFVEPKLFWIQVTLLTLMLPQFIIFLASSADFMNTFLDASLKSEKGQKKNVSDDDGMTV